jgi:hypothetical protein
MWLGCGILVLLNTSSGQHFVFMGMPFVAILSRQKPFFSEKLEEFNLKIFK